MVQRLRLRERVDTDVRSCFGRLSWRHRARPSTTLHEIQARSKGAGLNLYLCDTTTVKTDASPGPVYPEFADKCLPVAAGTPAPTLTAIDTGAEDAGRAARRARTLQGSTSRQACARGASSRSLAAAARFAFRRPSPLACDGCAGKALGFSAEHFAGALHAT